MSLSNYPNQYFLFMVSAVYRPSILIKTFNLYFIKIFLYNATNFLLLSKLSITHLTILKNL